MEHDSSTDDLDLDPDEVDAMFAPAGAWAAAEGGTVHTLHDVLTDRKASLGRPISGIFTYKWIEYCFSFPICCAVVVFTSYTGASTPL